MLSSTCERIQVSFTVLPVNCLSVLAVFFFKKHSNPEENAFELDNFLYCFLYHACCCLSQYLVCLFKMRQRFVSSSEVPWGFLNYSNVEYSFSCQMLSISLFSLTSHTLLLAIYSVWIVLTVLSNAILSLISLPQIWVPAVHFT